MLTSRPTVLLAFAGCILKVGARKNIPPTTVQHDREEMRNSSYLATRQAVHLHGEAWQRTSFNRRGAFRTEEHSLQAIVVVVYSGPKCYWSCRNETTIIISQIPTFHPVLHTEFTTAAPQFVVALKN